MNFPAAFDGRRLRRHAWTVPFKLAFAPVGLAVVYFLLPIVLNYPWALATDPFGVIAYLVYAIGPVPLGITAFFGIFGLMWGLGYGSSASKVLAQQLGVRELGPTDPLTVRVHRIADALNLPPPKVAVMPTTVNAYAIGSSTKDSAVVLGLPLVHGLTSDELDAVIGHELGHIVSGDMRRMQMAAGFQSMVDGMIDGSTRAGAEIGSKQSRNALTGLLIYLFGQLLRATVFLISELLVKRLSRSREYVADAFGALASTPQAMASALQKLQTLAPAPTAVSKQHQCLMFWNSGGSVFATHPTLDKRLAALQHGRHAETLLTKGCGVRGQKAKAAAVRFASQGTAYARTAQGAANQLLADPSTKARLQSWKLMAVASTEKHLPVLTALGLLLGMYIGYQMF